MSFLDTLYCRFGDSYYPKGTSWETECNRYSCGDRGTSITPKNDCPRLVFEGESRNCPETKTEPTDRLDCCNQARFCPNLPPRLFKVYLFQFHDHCSSFVSYDLWSQHTCGYTDQVYLYFRSFDECNWWWRTSHIIFVSWWVARPWKTIHRIRSWVRMATLQWDKILLATNEYIYTCSFALS